MESLSDIVAQMRRNGDAWSEDKSTNKTECLGLITLKYADLIEAAWRREKAEIEANALEVGGIVDAARHTPGNVAAMREALVALRDAARNFCQQILNSKYNDIMDEYKCRERGFPALLDLFYAIPKANVALSAPARQCDVGTAEEQERRYKATGEVYHTLTLTNALAWAQTPYGAEGGAQ